jgi:hypothetical protein
MLRLSSLLKPFGMPGRFLVELGNGQSLVVH